MKTIEKLLTDVGHIVKVVPHRCRFGNTWQPTCIECGFVGPFVSKARAIAIAEEHRLKSVDLWGPAW